MKMSTEFIKRHSLVLGIVLMFLFTWPIDLANSGVLPIQIPLVVTLFLGWGFVFASVIMTGLTLGKDGVAKLLKRFLIVRVGWKWYLVAVSFGPAALLGGIYLNAALTGVSPDFSGLMVYKILGKSAILPLMILPWFLYEVIANGEEIGWRGYILPRLQTKFNALTSSLILGLIWGFWHLPKYLSHFSIVSFGWAMIHFLALAVVLTWIYNGTRGSLLLVTMVHAAGNTASMFLPVANTTTNENMGAYIAFVLLEVVAALVIIVFAGAKRLSRTEPMQKSEVAPLNLKLQPQIKQNP